MIFERGHFSDSRLDKSIISNSLQESRNFSTNSHEYKKTVFLSHKHSDLYDIEEAKGVISLLQSFGCKVYIDSMDKSMPTRTSTDTAIKIKEIIKHCDKFILVATEKAIKSYWCNWELGIGDVHKYIKHIALIPIKERNTSDNNYIGNEYLQLYPKIDYENGTSQYKNGNTIPRGYYVCQPKKSDGSYNLKPLKEWLKS